MPGTSDSDARDANKGQGTSTPYETLFKKFPVAMALYRADGSLADVNARAARIMGRTRRELLASYNVLTDGRALEQGHDQAFRRALDGEEVRLEAVACGPGSAQGDESSSLVDRSRAWVELLFHPLEPESGSGAHVCCVFLEVTDRMRAQAALKHSYAELEQRVQDRTFALRTANLELQREIMERERVEDELRIAQEEYRSLLENATVGVFRISSQGRFLDVNPELCRIYGLVERETFLADHPEMSSLFQDKGEWRSFLELLTNHGRVNHFEARHVNRSGETIWAHMTARAVTDESGNIAGFEGFLSDVTERKRGETRLLGLHRLKEDLLRPLSLTDKMRRITDGLVEILDADFARIWLIKPGDRCASGCEHAMVTKGPHACRERDKCLHLVASSGRYSEVDGAHARVPFGSYKIGRVAAAKEQGFLTNDVTHDPRVHNHAWAKELGLTSFAGYRLTSQEDETMGVIALFSKRLFTDADENLLRTVANTASEVVRLAVSMDALRDSERRYRGLFENSHDGIFVAVPGEKFLDVNPAMATILGYDSPAHYLEVVKDPSTQLYVQKEDREAFVAVLRDQGTVENQEVRVKTRDGGYLWVSINARLVDGDGEHPHLVEGTARDITMRKRTERRLEVLIRHLKTAVQDRTRKLTEKAHLLEEANERLTSMDEMKSAFLSSVSHELRTPMTSIMGFAKIICREFERRFLPMVGSDPALGKSARRIRDNLEIVWLEGERLTRLINDVLDLNKIESGRMEWRDQEVRLDHVLEQAVDAVRGQFALKPGIALEVNSDKNLPLVLADPDRLTQVLVNLLNNAAKFTHWGSVSVTAQRDGQGGILIRVSDTGDGIPSEDLEAIFDKFRQASIQGRPTPGPQGTGLGLTICRQIVERYGGDIWVESVLGEGSTFAFSLPPERTVDN